MTLGFSTKIQACTSMNMEVQLQALQQHAAARKTISTGQQILSQNSMLGNKAPCKFGVLREASTIRTAADSPSVGNHDRISLKMTKAHACSTLPDLRVLFGWISWWMFIELTDRSICSFSLCNDVFDV